MTATSSHDQGRSGKSSHPPPGHPPPTYHPLRLLTASHLFYSPLRTGGGLERKELYTAVGEGRSSQLRLTSASSFGTKESNAYFWHATHTWYTYLKIKSNQKYFPLFFSLTAHINFLDLPRNLGLVINFLHMDWLPGLILQR